MSIQPPSSRRKKVGFGILYFAVAVGVAVFLGMVAQKLRSDSQLHQCQDNLRLIEIGFLNYHDAFKHFPPAITRDADGKPMHSWRISLVPFLQSGPTYSLYNKKEPWNGPNNSKLTDQMPEWYRCPTSTGGPYETNDVVVVGDQTAFPGCRAISFREITDGTSKTITVVEVANSGIPWLEPRDLSLEEALKGINPKDDHGLCISSNHPGGANVGYGDAHVEFLENSTTPEKLKKLLTINDDYEPRISGGATETRLRPPGYEGRRPKILTDRKTSRSPPIATPKE